VWPEADVRIAPDELLLETDADRLAGRAPLTIHFSAAPMDPNEAIAPVYVWSFGDGSPDSSEQNPTHTYAKPGTYSATVRVVESGGKRGNDEFAVTVYEGD
jgi:PKD repeat protein